MHYKMRDNYSTAAVIARHALHLYTELTDKHPQDNNDLGYKLILENTEISVIQTLRELYGGEERESTFCDMFASFVDGSQHSKWMLEKNFSMGLTKKVRQFCEGVNRDYAVMIDCNIHSTSPQATHTLMRAFDLIATDISAELRGEFREMFDYIRAISNYFASLKEGLGGRPYKLTAEDTEILERFVKKARSGKTQVIPAVAEASGE